MLSQKLGVSDEADFYEALQSSPVDKTRFENHWPYIIQATRNSGFVYKENRTRIYYYLRSIRELVVVNILSDDKAGALSVLKRYAIENNLALCVKNIPVQDLPYWENSGYREAQRAWNDYSSKDDNSYPECIYDLKVIAEAHLPVKPNHIRACRETHSNRLRKFLRERDIHVRPYEPELHREAVYKLLVENAEFLHQKGVDSRQNVIDAHMFVFDDRLLHKVRLVHMENGCILGFNYITVVDDTIFGNALIHKNSSDLMRFLVWQGFNYLSNHLEPHKRYLVTLQGSENKGQYHWKKGFSPLRENVKTHITLFSKSDMRCCFRSMPKSVESSQ